MCFLHGSLSLSPSILELYTNLPWREIKTKDTLEPKMGCIKAKQRKKASGKFVSQIQASSDGNTHLYKVKAQAEGGGREKQTEQKQGITRIKINKIRKSLKITSKK